MSLRRALAEGDWKFRCCGKDEKGEGCTYVCDKCGEMWGTKPPGCVMIRHPDRGQQESSANYEFEQKDHNLQEIDD